MNIRILVDLQTPAELKPAIGEICKVERIETVPNGKTMYFIAAENGTQIGVLPEECEVSGE